MDMQRASVEATEANAERTSEGSDTNGKGVAKPKSSSSDEGKGKSPAEENREKALSDKKEGGYSRLDQKRKEKTRLGTSKRSEKKAKAEAKKV